jgi:hypothetical protein
VRRETTPSSISSASVEPIHFALAHITERKIIEDPPSPPINSPGSEELLPEPAHDANSVQSPTPKPVASNVPRRRPASPHPLALPRPRVTQQYEPMPLELVVTAQKFAKAHEIIAERPLFDDRLPPRPLDQAPSRLMNQKPSQSLNQTSSPSFNQAQLHSSIQAPSQSLKHTPSHSFNQPPTHAFNKAPSQAFNRAPLRGSNRDGGRNRGEVAINGSSTITRRANPYLKPGGHDYASSCFPPEQRSHPQLALGQGGQLKPKQGLDEPVQNGRVSLNVETS